MISEKIHRSADEGFMKRCIMLAKLGAGLVAPNPMVGAVLVYEGRIIGEGFHKKFGGPHAEPNCIGSVSPEDKHLIKAATLYVSLEPCSHFGKTPPCTDLIIFNAIPRVVVGCRDPFEKVNGRGIECLRQAGIEVVVGMLEAACQELNKRFFCFNNLHRPYIILKWAQTVNSKIGFSDVRLLISNQFTNRIVHRWRSEEASVLVGTNTAAVDDPELTVRLWKGPSPIRLVVDMDLRLPLSLKLFEKTVRTIVFNKNRHEDVDTISYFRLDPGDNLAVSIVKALFDLGIQSVIVEGGGKLLQLFIDSGMWDEARIITNTELSVENGISAPELGAGASKSAENIFSDRINIYERKAGLVLNSKPN